MGHLPIRRLLTLLEHLSHRVQEVIAAFNLVPKEQVILTELEFLNFQTLHERNSHSIEHGKNPATSCRLLIGHWPCFVDLVTKYVIMRG